MRTIAGFPFICIFTLLFLTGCGDETVTEPVTRPAESLSLAISGLPVEARASTGVELQLPFTVAAFEDKDAPVVGQTITVWVDSGPGTIIGNPLTTDSNGVATAIYAATLLPDQPNRTVIIKARSGGAVASASMILIETPRPARLALSTATPQVFASVNEPARITVKVNAIDENGGSIAGVAVRCSVQPAFESGPVFGSVTREVVTDSRGEAEILFNSLDGYGLISVRVEEKYPPAEPAVAGSITLEVRELSQKIGSLEMFLDPDSVVVEGREDIEIQVMIRVMGEDRQPLSGMPVSLTAQYSSAAPAPLTDEYGVSRTIWRINPRRDLPGLPEEGLAVIITSAIPGTDWETSGVVVFMPKVYPSGLLTLFTDDRSLSCDGPGGKQLTLTASLRNENGQYLEGRELQVYVSSNHAVAAPNAVTNNLGRAEILVDDIGSDQIIDGEVVTITVRQLDMNLEAALLVFLVKFDESVSIHLQTNRTTLVAGSGDSTTVRAVVLLADNSPARIGTIVRFHSRLGYFAPASAPVNGADGSVETRYFAGRARGTDTLQARVERLHSTYFSNQVIIGLTAGPPRSLLLSCADLTVRRGESTEITAHIEDGNGDPASGLIHFSTDNGSIAPIQQADAEGNARVVFNANRLTGAATILAWVSGRDQGEIYADTLRLHIAGLPPVQLELDIGSDGAAVGGAAWEIPVTVRVADGEGQPVEDGLPITFTVNPPIAQLQNVETGNEDAFGERLPGVAHGRLIYQSQFTNESITVTAEVESGGAPLQASRVLTLPLQRGSIELNVDPANWMFVERRDHAVVRIWAVVRDGHGVAVNGARVLFTTSRSRLSWYNFDSEQYVQYFPNPAVKITGVTDRENFEEPGTATVFLEADMNDIFLDPFTLEVRVEINASVPGNDDVISEPRFIQFTRLAR